MNLTQKTLNCIPLIHICNSLYNCTDISDALWMFIFAPLQVLRVLVQLYLNLTTPDFISVCQVGIINQLSVVR